MYKIGQKNEEQSEWSGIEKAERSGNEELTE